MQTLVKERSIFLFGARGTGKTTLIDSQLKEKSVVYDLLDEKTFLKLTQDSSVLDRENDENNSLIVIDEIQKLPKLLDEIQRLMTKKKHRFLLTGSSARKLKREGVNLLGGRAREHHLLPLSWSEIPKFDLLKYINRGGLPLVYLSSEPLEDLKSYVGLYLQEEIAKEALARKVEWFSRFLEVIALQNGEELQYSSLASDTGIKAKTLENYVEVLEDTLLGFRLSPYSESKKRKAITRSKFFLFDLGVTGLLCHRSEVAVGSELFGKVFEHFIVLEVRAAQEYLKKKEELSYWRTKSGFEVDLVVNGHTAIEIKATHSPSLKHLKGLKALQEEKLLKRFILVCQVDRPQKWGEIEILPWTGFLELLWNGEIL